MEGGVDGLVWVFDLYFCSDLIGYRVLDCSVCWIDFVLLLMRGIFQWDINNIWFVYVCGCCCKGIFIGYVFQYSLNGFKGY